MKCLRSVPLLVLAIATALWSSPAAAKQCANEERNRLRLLERELARCGDDPDCETRARDACFRQLSRAGCNVSVCGSTGVGAGTGDQCALNSAANATQALDALLTNQLLTQLNAEWSTTATTPPPDPTGLDPYTLPRQEVEIPDGCSNDGGDFVCGTAASSCSKVVANFTPTIQGLSQLQFSSLAVQSLTTQDLSTGSSRGPDASRIHMIVPFPAEGGAWNSASAVVLPGIGVSFAITTDLGQVFTLCADGMKCPAVMLQAQGDDTYTVDYSVDGVQWTNWFNAQAICSTCTTLRNRSVTISGNVQARYLRTYASASIGSNQQFSVSQLQFYALQPGPGGTSVATLISQFRPARGPQPKLTTGPFPAAGSAYNAPLATVLPSDGPASALTIDLGKAVTIPANTGILLMTSGNDVYTLEYSTDGASWTQWVEIPVRCGCNDLEGPYFLPGAVPSVTGRYFRIYHPSGTAGDGLYSVAELGFSFDGGGTGGMQFFGPEALATNGEFAPPGTNWNDARYATQLAGEGPQHSVLIDLGQAAGRGINRVVIQADQNDTYVVDISQDAIHWVTIYVADPVPNTHGLQTRDSGDTLTDLNGNPWVGRYIRAYPLTGDGSYSISEVQIFNDSLQAGCPFDATANSIALGSAKCSYSGTITADAALPSGTPLKLHLSDLSVSARCAPLVGSDFDIPLYPAGGGSGTGNCTVSPFGLVADMNLCAVTCDTSSGSTPPVEITYMQEASLAESATSGSPSCTVDTAFSSAQLEADVIAAIRATLRPLFASAVRDVQNSLLRGITPFPGEQLASGARAVCTSQ